MDFDFFSFFLGVAVGLGIAWIIVNLVGRMIYHRLEAVLEEQSQSDSKDKRIELKVERHGDMLYAFRSDDDGFVCQGADLAELKANFIKRFPDHVGSVTGKTEDLHQELLKQKKELANEDSTGVRHSS